jgi:hypothetical protein
MEVHFFFAGLFFVANSSSYGANHDHTPQSDELHFPRDR